MSRYGHRDATMNLPRSLVRNFMEKCAMTYRPRFLMSAAAERIIVQGEGRRQRRRSTDAPTPGLPTCRSNIAHVSHVSAGHAHATAQANRGKPARHCEAHSPAGERHGGRASRGRGRHGNEGRGGATAGDDRKMNNEPLEREPNDRLRARLEALLKANAAPPR